MRGFKVQCFRVSRKASWSKRRETRSIAAPVCDRASGRHRRNPDGHRPRTTLHPRRHIKDEKGPDDVDVWTLPAAIFFGTMGMFAGVAALSLTGTRVRLLGHQAAEIVLFCLLFAIAVFAVIAAVYP